MAMYSSNHLHGLEGSLFYLFVSACITKELGSFEVINSCSGQI